MHAARLPSLRAVIATALLVAATYPLAFGLHALADLALGDGLFVRELQYGSIRLAATDVAAAWLPALAWTAAAWLALAVLRGLLGRAYVPVAAAAALALLAAALLGGAVPAMLAWLLTVAFVLERVAARVLAPVPA